MVALIRQWTVLDWTAAAVLFLSVLGFAWTGHYAFVAAPFLFLFVVLFGLNWKAAFWVLLATIPFSVDLWLMDGALATSLPDEPIMWMFLLLLPLLLARNPGIIPRWWFGHPIVLLIFFQFLWMLVAVAFSREIVFSLKFALAKSWFLATFFVIPLFVFRKKADFRMAFTVFLIPLLITALIIMYRHAQLSFHFRRVEKAIGSLYYNHVDYSTVLSMFLPLIWVAFSQARQRPLIRLFLFILLLAFLPILYFTYARAALLAVVFALGVGLAIKMKLAQWVMPAFYGLVALLMVYMIQDNQYLEYRPNYERTYMRKNFAEHVVATFRGEDMSSMERLYRWIAAVRMSQDEPVKGVGPNAFYYYYKPYAVTSFKTYVSRNPEQSTTHNYFLYLLTEQGWPAMILYALLIMVAFVQAQRTYWRFQDRFYRNCTLGVAMLLAAAFINNFFSELIETHKVGSLFYLGLALLVILDRISRTRPAGEEEGLSPVGGNQVGEPGSTQT